MREREKTKHMQLFPGGCISLWFSGRLVYHPQTTKKCSRSSYQKFIDYNSDLRYCFRITIRFRVLIPRLSRVQQVFFMRVVSNVLKKIEIGKFSNLNGILVICISEIDQGTGPIKLSMLSKKLSYLLIICF